MAEVSKKWFRLRDTYGVEIAPGQNDVLILAITVCVDMMAHGGRVATTRRARRTPRHRWASTKTTWRRSCHLTRRPFNGVPRGAIRAPVRGIERIMEFMKRRRYIPTMIMTGLLLAAWSGEPAVASPAAPVAAGLQASQIQLDTQGLPYSWQATAMPATPYDASQPPGPTGLPAHILITFGVTNPADRRPGDPVMYIIPVAAYEQLWEQAGKRELRGAAAELEAAAAGAAGAGVSELAEGAAALEVAGALGDVSRAAVAAGASDLTRGLDQLDVARGVETLSRVVAEAGVQDIAQGAELLATSEDIGVMSALVRAMGADDLDAGLAVSRVGGELAAVARLAERLDMPVLAAFLDDRGELLRGPERRHAAALRRRAGVVAGDGRRGRARRRPGRRGAGRGRDTADRRRADGRRRGRPGGGWRRAGGGRRGRAGGRRGGRRGGAGGGRRRGGRDGRRRRQGRGGGDDGRRPGRQRRVLRARRVQLQNGRPVNVATTLLGDRVKVDAVAIQNDQIVVDMVAHAPTDPLCCPTQRVLVTYELRGDQLWRRRATGRLVPVTAAPHRLHQPTRRSQQSAFGITLGAYVARQYRRASAPFACEATMVAMIESRPASPASIRPRRASLSTDVVRRARVSERLSRALLAPLTVLAAPAGSGKTTALRTWLEDWPLPHAWLSLDEDDDEVEAFLRRLIAAAQASIPRSGAPPWPRSRGRPRRPRRCWRPPSSASWPKRPATLLVLDDYHVIRDPAVHELMRRVVARLPDGVRLVVAARSAPPWPLARLRALGQVADIGAADLSFTTAEATALLELAAGRALDPAVVAAAQARAEGWALGLRLIGVAFRDRPDAVAVVARLHGDSNRDLLQYFLEEVLTRQPAPVQASLLTSSILDRFSPALCDAVAGDDPAWRGCDALDWPERTDLFLIALDDEPGWFRRHPLCREALRHELRKRHGSEAMARLHRRASAWFADQGMIDHAIRHTLAAGEEAGGRPAGRSERLRLILAERWLELEGWLDLLPVDVATGSPWLLACRAWTLWQRQDFGHMPALPGAAEALMTPLDAAPGDVPAATVQAAVDALWAAIYLFVGEPDQALDRADSRARGGRRRRDPLYSWAIFFEGVRAPIRRAA